MRAATIDIGTIDDQGRSSRIQLTEFGEGSVDALMLALEHLAHALADEGRGELVLAAVAGIVEARKVAA